MTIIIGNVDKKNRRASVISDVRVSMGYEQYGDKDINKVVSPNDNLLVGITGHAAFLNLLKRDEFGFAEFDELSDDNLTEMVCRIGKKLNDLGYVCKSSRDKKRKYDLFGNKIGKDEEVYNYKISAILLCVDTKGNAAKLSIETNTDKVQITRIKNRTHLVVGNGETEALGYLDAYDDLPKKKKEELKKGKLEIIRDAFDYICNTKPGVGGTPNYDTIEKGKSHETTKLI